VVNKTETAEKKIIAAAVTPFGKDFKIDVTSTKFLIDYLFKEGLTDILLFGTTGEAASISLSEKLSLLKTLSKSEINKESIWVGTGLTSFKETIYLSNNALDLGFSNLLILPPYYYKNITEDGLYDYFSILLNNIDSKNAQLFLYHFPKMTGIPFGINLVKKLFNQFPFIRGVKDSTGELLSLNNFIKIDSSFEVFAGNEKYFLKHLNNGGKGVISATFNVLAKIASETLAQYFKKDERMFASEKRLIDLRRKIEQYPLIPAVKFLLSVKFNNKDFEIVRPPLKGLNKKEKNNLLELLNQLDFRL